MKLFYTFLISIVALVANAQAPQGFNYQATVRNNAGALMTNASVQLKFSILQDTATGTVVYSESQTKTTDGLGQVSTVVGQGTALTGTFAAINWGTGTHFLAIELNTGNGFVAMGTTQLLSVPYALYANSAGNSQGVQGPAGQDGKNTLVNTTTEPAGTNCANGGTKIEVGLDVDGNGILDTGEVNASLTKYICNGNATSNNGNFNDYIFNDYDNGLTVGYVNTCNCGFQLLESTVPLYNKNGFIKLTFNFTSGMQNGIGKVQIFSPNNVLLTEIIGNYASSRLYERGIKLDPSWNQLIIRSSIQSSVVESIFVPNLMSSEYVLFN